MSDLVRETKRETENGCQHYAATLIRELNNFTIAYAFKYPDCKELGGCEKCPYELKREDFISMDKNQKDKCIQLFDSLAITPVGYLGEQLNEEQKCELLSNYLDEYRTPFFKEEERVIYTEAFRRLQYKTQVMVNSASDDQRTRLLHSLEVQKIGRKIAIALRANYELVEAITIAHDIGHAPFGHAGEQAINDYLESRMAGAFSHALQSVKVVDFLGKHRALNPKGFYGLGLSDFTLEGILKHDTDTFSNNVASAAFRLQYDCPNLYTPVGTKKDYSTNKVWIGSLESQIVCWADKIAYMSHDWEEFVSVDLLEVMVSRINLMVMELDAFIHKKREKKNDYLSDIEKDNLTSINDKFEELKHIFYANADDAHFSHENEKFLSALSDLIKAIEEAIQLQSKYPSSFFFFSNEQYNLFCSFFRIAWAWIIITDVFPETVSGKMDIIFVIYQYLCNTTSHRTVPALIKRLVSSCKEKFNDSKYDSMDRDTFIAECNKGELISGRTVHMSKQERKIYKKEIKKSFAVSFSDEYFSAIEAIGDFIYSEFINSTRVQFMTKKAEKIVVKLLDYYYENQQMLPLKYRKRIEFEKSSPSITNKITNLLKEYYSDRINEAIIEDERENNKKDLHYLNVARIIRTHFAALGLEELNEYDSSNSSEMIEHIKSVIESNKKITIDAITLRVISDYVSGMTDRMAEKKYNEICSSSTQWSKTFSERATFTI